MFTFNLPYWCKLEVRHCIDVMHVEKNVCDSVIGTLLNIKGKIKDGVKAQQNLVDMGIRSELHPQSIGKRTYLPPVCHTLSKKEKKSFEAHDEPRVRNISIRTGVLDENAAATQALGLFSQHTKTSYEPYPLTQIFIFIFINSLVLVAPFTTKK
uniref:Uncharacterized protein n=1 Tax=Cajanus cajan TaxID=3821 RepID=A0A151UGQ4_CAJCA